MTIWKITALSTRCNIIVHSKYPRSKGLHYELYHRRVKQVKALVGNGLVVCARLGTKAETRHYLVRVLRTNGAWIEWWMCSSWAGNVHPPDLFIFSISLHTSPPAIDGRAHGESNRITASNIQQGKWQRLWWLVRCVLSYTITTRSCSCVHRGP